MCEHTTRVVLSKLLRLVEMGILVRNTKWDADMSKYLRDSVTLCQVLKEAQLALEEPSDV